MLHTLFAVCSSATVVYIAFVLVMLLFLEISDEMLLGLFIFYFA